MVDALVLGTSRVTCGGSSPLPRTDVGLESMRRLLYTLPDQHFPPLAQLVEQLALNETVQGSSP
ncbi:MAG: hypothetical protein RL538_602 [Candidatus Parcubacteria bacterium]